MKRICAFLLAALMLCAPLTVLAGSFDSVFTGNVTFTNVAKYGSAVLNGYQLRAFCTQKGDNAKYYFGGTLQNGPKFFKFDAATGAKLAQYEFSHDVGAYIKGCASDDRGYVYAGIANKANNASFFFSILDVEKWTEVSYLEEKASTTKLGVNSCFIWKTGSTYYLYVLSNYETDRIYRYNVTDVKKPVKDTSWGNQGYIDINADFKMNDGNGIAVGDDGSIYLGGKTASSGTGDTLLKLTPTGKQVSSLAVKEIWGVDFYRGYVLCCTRNKTSSEVVVVDAATMKQVASYKAVATAEGFSGVGIMNDKIYVADHGQNNDAVYVSNALNIPKPVASTAAAATTKAAATTAAKAATTSAKTADLGVVFAAIALTAGAALVVCKKRK